MLSLGGNCINGLRSQWDDSPNLRGKVTFCHVAFLSHASIYAYTLFPFLAVLLLKSSGLSIKQAVLLKSRTSFKIEVPL